MRRWDAPKVDFDFQNDVDAVEAIRGPRGREPAARRPRRLGRRRRRRPRLGLHGPAVLPANGFGPARVVILTPSLGPRYRYGMGEAIGRALEGLGKAAGHHLQRRPVALPDARRSQRLRSRRPRVRHRLPGCHRDLERRLGPRARRASSAFTPRKTPSRRRRC